VVRRVIFLALPLLLGLAGIGGYLLATHSLAPLNWMAAQAREITGSNLSRRLEIGRAAEELTLLAASFNELLARLDESFEAMRRFVADASHELRTPIARDSRRSRRWLFPTTAAPPNTANRWPSFWTNRAAFPAWWTIC